MKNYLLLLALAGTSLVATAQTNFSLSTAVAPAEMAKPTEMSDYRLVTLDPEDWNEVADRPTAEALRFALPAEISEKTFTLHRFEQRASGHRANYRSAAGRKPSAQWVGPGANFTIDDNFVLGRWREDGEDMHLEPLWLQVPDAPRNLYVVYRESDLIATNDRHCKLVKPAGHEPPRPAEGNGEKAAGECFIVEIALASDLLLFQALGSAASVENFMLGVLADVQTDYDDAFADELRYEVTATYIATSAATDPWSDTTDPVTIETDDNDNQTFSGLLFEFTEWANDGGFGGANYDVASLWTDRNFDGATVGIAWQAQICQSFNYNALEHFEGANATTLRVLWSHELGHNWSAEHDAGSGFIMSESVNATNTWSSTSVAAIEAYYGNASCLSACPATQPPVAAATTSFPEIYTGGKVPFEDLTTSPTTSRSWSFPGGVPATSDLPLPLVAYPNPGRYTATLTVSNAAGSNSTSVNVDVATESGRIKLMSFETLEAGATVELEVDNPDGGDNTWQVEEVGGNNGSRAAFVNNFITGGNGQVDRLQIPVQDFSDLPSPTLEFEYAYRRYDETFNDELRVRISTDGVSFTEIFRGRENGSQNFATGPDLESVFIPQTAQDWCFTGPQCVSLNLGEYAGEPTVFVEIENFNGFGNVMWVDNIVLSGAAGTVLPVDWLSFTARATGKTARLNWSVEQDEANTGFHVERAAAAGNDWQDLAWMPATTGRIVADYTYDDHTVSPGQTYLYRLRQTDNDGRESYSEIQEVRFADAGFASLFPNPAGTETRLQTPFATGTYELVTTAGRRLREGRVNDAAATVSLRDLPAGLYFVRLRGQGGETEVLRLVKR